MASFLKYNWPSILWAAFIFYLCMISGSHLPHIHIPNLDKAVHFTFYLVLVLLMYTGWKKQASFPSLYQNSLLKIFAIACAYGFAIEIMQELFTVDRHFEWLDEAADACGALLGCWLSVKTFKYTARFIR